MSPVFRRENEYTFKIYSNEEERMHIHVLCGGHEAKFLQKSQVELARYLGVPEHKLNEIKKIVDRTILFICQSSSLMRLPRSRPISSYWKL